MSAPAVPLLLSVDGNSLLHRAYHAAATGRLLDDDGRPVWAMKGLIGFIARAAARLRPDALVVGFDCPDDSARKADYPAYKGHRPDKPADLAEQLAEAPGLLRAAGFCTVVPRSYEADDVLASSSEQARRNGWRSIVVTSDRDAFALIDATTSVLRVRNGGLDEAILMTAASLPDLYGVEPSQYRDYAALCGDSSDNLPGVRGFGAVTAARLLATFGSVDTAWDALDNGDDAAVRAAVGDAAAESLASPETRDAVHRNRRLMRMRADLPLPDLDSARLPLDLASMRRALAERGIRLGPSLWALTGGAPPLSIEELPAALRPWMPISARRRREPSPDQLTLF